MEEGGKEVKEVQASQDICLSEEKSYGEAGLDSYLVKCYESLGYKNPTPIQYYSIKTFIGGGGPSILAQSKSGTGKTLSYISLILTDILSKSTLPVTCRYLMMVPTRQLSLQVYQIFKQLINSFQIVKASSQPQKQSRMKLKMIKLMMCIGGIPFQDDKKNYNLNGGNVIVGTIGRVLELIDKKIIRLNELQMLVLDEGDKLFENKNKRFSQVVENAVNYQQNNLFKIKLLIYSATFTTKLLKELNKQRQYTFIQTLADSHNKLQLNITDKVQQLVSIDESMASEGIQTADSLINLDNIKKYKYITKDEGLSFFNAKIQALVHLLQVLNYQRCLVFVEKKSFLEQINERVITAGLDPLLIHGSLSQSARIKLMNQINHSKIIIASDLLARGIDIELDLVILFDAKRNDTFWHRIGRTGRYGKMGVAISLDNVEDWEQYEQKAVQGQLDSIVDTFKRNKDWYGTYMTEMGSWNETNQEKEMQQEKEYRYFDEERGKGSKKRKMEETVAVPVVAESHSKEHLIEELAGIKDHATLSNYLQKFKKCPKCQIFITQIESLTGYSFLLRNYG